MQMCIRDRTFRCISQLSTQTRIEPYSGVYLTALSNMLNRASAVHLRSWETKMCIRDRLCRYSQSVNSFGLAVPVFTAFFLCKASFLKSVSYTHLEEYGLPKPKFQEFDNMFRVELFRVNPITDQANQALSLIHI